jgi:hypothetical protein
MADQLALPGPFGLGNKSIHFSIRAPNDRFEEVRGIAVRMGCPVFVADKVEECIKHSGRYDCLVMPDVSIEKTRRELEDIGGSLEVDDLGVNYRLLESLGVKQPSLTLSVQNASHGLFTYLYQGSRNDAEWRYSRSRRAA